MVELSQPAIFIGHGSPMNIVADNDYTRALKKWSANLPTPKNILVISAHWVTAGTQILKTEKPKTIYDFYGFPEILYQQKYDALGATQLADETFKTISLKDKLLTEDWGLDHGAWAVLKFLFPKANIPVTQLSLNQNFTLKQHYDLAKELSTLRQNGTLILSSGNLVHNLRDISWEESAPVFDWAQEFDEKLKHYLDQKNHQALINPEASFGALFRKAHPTIEHYVPLMYSLGLMNDSSQLNYNFEGFQNASISMRSFSILPR